MAKAVTAILANDEVARLTGPGARATKRSVTIAGHRTSVSLEQAYWDTLQAEAARRGVSLAALIAAIDEARTGNLSGALRVFVLGLGTSG